MSQSGSPLAVDGSPHGSGHNSPRLDSGAPSKVSKSTGWRATSQALHIGSVIDDWPMYSSQASDYILGAPIGFGASSVVYQAAFQPLSGRACAVKVIDLEAFGRDLAELRRETQVMSLSKHPNVLRVRGCWVHGAKLHIATRLMNAGSMLDIMRFSFSDGFEENVIASVLKQALEGLNYLHVNGWLHRDLKAANMLVDDDGTVLLGDFGVGVYLTETAKNFDRSSNSAMAGDDADGKMDAIDQASRKSFVGTPCWMAPEVVERKGYGAKADVWSFGITALELSSGRAPHSRLPPVKVLMRTLQDAPPRLDREGGAFKYSKLFDDFVRQCLQKDPNKRPSAERLLQHGFFKQARSKRYLANAILSGLPPLVERQERRRAMSIASLQNQASWDFGSMGRNSLMVTTPGAEGQDPFFNFSGAVASPRGSVRMSKIVSIDGEHAVIEDGDANINVMRDSWRNSVGSARSLSRPPIGDLSAITAGTPGSWAKRRRSRSQRLSVSFHVDEKDELLDPVKDGEEEELGELLDKTALNASEDVANPRVPADGALPSIDESSGKGDTSVASTENGDMAQTPSVSDGSTPSSKHASLDQQAEVPTKKRDGGRLLNLFKRP